VGEEDCVVEYYLINSGNLLYEGIPKGYSYKVID